MLRLVALAIVLISSAKLTRAADASALWHGKVQKIFDVQCVKCHGPIEQKGGLELDTPEAVMKGGENGAVVKPGKPEESALYVNLAAKGDPHMPPKKQLSDAEREAVKEWIAAMTVEAPRQNAPKMARKFESGVQAIDALIAEGWERAKVKPATAVSDEVWCRRLYLDLSGRIPTSAEVSEFIKAGAKREALVDRLLASKDYAVRMRELWDVFLLGRVKRGDPDGRRKGSGWWTFLETAFQKNRPWNDVVNDVLCARPDKTPETFAGMRERALTGEQIARSWRVALGLSPDDDGRRKAIVSAMPDVLPKDYNATFQQTQFLSDSPTMTQLFQAAKDGTIARLAALPDAKSRVNEFFLMAGRQAQGTWNAALFNAKDGSLVMNVDTKNRITHARFVADGKRLITSNVAGGAKPKDGKWPDGGRVQVFTVEG